MTSRNWMTKLKTNKIFLKRSRTIIRNKKTMTKIEYKNQRGPMCTFQGRKDKRRKKKQSMVTNRHMLLSHATQKKENPRLHFHPHDERANLAIRKTLHALPKRHKRLPCTGTWRTCVNNFLNIKTNYST